MTSTDTEGSEPGTVGLDPEWIAANSTVDGRTPVRAEFAGFVGTGQMSRNARFTLDWGSAAGPSSVVVKVPSDDPGTRALSFEHGAYANECEFYRSVAPLVDVVAPAALAVHFDATALDFAIVLEDLSGSEQGDQFTEPTDDQLVLAVEQAVALQAPVWGATDGPAFAVYRDGAAERGTNLQALLPMFLPAVFERLGDGLDADVSELIVAFVDQVGSWHDLQSRQITLVHGDFRPDNFMFGAEDGAPAMSVVDWQTLALGLGVTDIAYLLGAAVAPERRREIEHDMLGRYVDGLGRRGIDYAMDECLADYALGSLHGVLVAVTATTVAAQTERGDALFTLMLNRHGRHGLDLDALSRLRAS